MPEAVELKKPSTVAAITPKQAKGGSLEPWEFDRLFRHYAEPGVTREDLTKPGFFSVAGDGRLMSFDKIDVIGHGGAYWCQLLVTYAEDGFTPTVEELCFRDTSRIERGKHGNVPAGHEIQYDTQKCVYAGFRTHDKNGKPLNPPVQLTQDLPKYEDARAQLMNHATLRV